MAGARVLTPDDIYNYVLVNDAQISPDGGHVAFVQTVLDRELNDYRSNIHLISTNGGPARAFTGSGARDTFPRWSPDGSKIAFLSKRSGTNQIWTIAIDGGEATQLTDLPEPVSYFAWSPDGSTIAFVSKTEASQLTKQADQSGDEKSDVVHITRLRFRSEGTPGFLDGKRSHIWCIDTAGGKPWQVTQGDWDDTRPSWSANGQEIAFSSNRTERAEFNNASEIWAIHARGGQARLVTGGDEAAYSSPAWSAQSDRIAFIGHGQASKGGTVNPNLHLSPAAGGSPVNLTGKLDRLVGDTAMSDTFASSETGLAWSPDSTGIYFLLSDSGNVGIYRALPEKGEVKQIVGGQRRIQDFSLSADGRKIAFTWGDPLNPCDISVVNADGSGERQLTRVNAEFLNSVALSKPEEFRVPSQAEDKAEIHGWVMKPIGFQEGQKYPLILEIHGGPHNMYANVFFNEMQLLAAQGYVVLYTNPRGSQGYGEAFSAYTQGAWGERDMPDLMAAVDWAIEQGYADPNRLGVTGGSYGGYMTNWVIGHTDRFKAAVTQRSVTNMYSFFGTSDIGSTFGAFETGGLPWEEPEKYFRMSPISYVKDIVTPLLIIHSEQDYRCPIEQAEQLYVMLKVLGREVEFVRFPNENHNLSRGGQPKHRIERLNYILGWFEKHL